MSRRAAHPLLALASLDFLLRPRGGETRQAISEQDAEALLNLALDAGVGLIDTSPDYGRSEELSGRFISHRRSEFFLASTCGRPINPPPGERLGGLPETVARRRDLWGAAGLDAVMDGLSPVEFLLRFTLSHPDVTATIVGTANPQHLAQNFAAA